MTPSVFRAVATCVVPEAGGLDAAQWDEMEAIVARAIAARPRALQRQLALFFTLLAWPPLLRYGRRLSRLDAGRRARGPDRRQRRGPRAEGRRRARPGRRGGPVEGNRRPWWGR